MKKSSFMFLISDRETGADVVKSFAKIVDKMPAKLLLVGDGPEMTHIDRTCRDN